MPYKWKTKVDVDETIVVIMNVLDKNPELPNWLVMTITGSISDSNQEMVKYFFNEVKHHVPATLKILSQRCRKARFFSPFDHDHPVCMEKVIC